MIKISNTLSNAEYHALPAANASGLKLMARSPLHYWAQYIAPDREPRAETPAMKIGTAAHAALLEPVLFLDKYVRVPDGLDRRTKEGKALFAEIEASGKIALSGDDYDGVCAMAKAGRAHPEMAHALAQGGAVEQSIFVTDPDTGALCKIRPDFAVLPGLIVDVKTTENATNDEFVRSVWKYDYALQAAFYVDMYQLAHALDEPPAFRWFVQEKSSPYACVMYTASDDLLEFGRRQYQPLLQQWVECMRTGVWPGYPTEARELALPAWAAKQVSPVDSEEIEVSYAE